MNYNDSIVKETTIFFCVIFLALYIALYLYPNEYDVTKEDLSKRKISNYCRLQITHCKMV